MKALFISEETLLDNSIINENVSYTQIRPTVVKVQEMRIQPIVGSALYGELITQVVSGSTSALNQTLLEDYIQPAMIQWLYYELPMVLAFKYMNKGMVRRTSEESSQMSMEEITRLTDKVKNDSEWYSERITRYLMENRNSYPLWNSPPSALDTIYPNATNYRTGMVLDRNRLLTMGAHKKNILKLQNYVLDKNQASPAGPCKCSSSGQLLRDGRPACNRNGQHHQPANPKP
jgi:hypothetical protein